MSVKVIGIKQLERMVGKLGKVPRKVARASARAGGQVELVAARAYAPVGYGYVAKKVTYGNTGDLRKGLMKAEEKSAYNNGKAVFDIRFNPKMNEIFQKPIDNPGKYGGQSSKAYYPASMEYGFKTAHGHWEGYHFLKNSADASSGRIKKAMVDKALESIDKILENG